MEQKRRGRPPGSKNRKKLNDSKSKTKGSDNTSQIGSRLKDEIWAIVILALGAFLAVSLQTEAAGQLGKAIESLLKGFFGITVYILPYYLILYGFLLFGKRTAHITGRSSFFLLLIFLCITTINASRFLAGNNEAFSLQYLRTEFTKGMSLDSGGLIGMALGYGLDKLVGMVGLFILCGFVLMASLLLVINTPISQFFDRWKIKR